MEHKSFPSFDQRCSPCSCSPISQPCKRMNYSFGSRDPHFKRVQLEKINQGMRQMADEWIDNTLHCHGQLVQFEKQVSTKTTWPHQPFIWDDCGAFGVANMTYDGWVKTSSYSFDDDTMILLKWLLWFWSQKMRLGSWWPQPVHEKVEAWYGSITS